MTTDDLAERLRSLGHEEFGEHTGLCMRCGQTVGQIITAGADCMAAPADSQPAAPPESWRDRPPQL